MLFAALTRDKCGSDPENEQHCGRHANANEGCFAGSCVGQFVGKNTHKAHVTHFSRDRAISIISQSLRPCTLGLRDANSADILRIVE